MRKLSMILAAVTFTAFANANAGSKVYISPVPVPNDITKAQYEGIDDWIEIKGIGSHGETGMTTNILTYDTWDTAVALKAKGISDAGSPEIEIARVPGDLGQAAINTASGTNFNYAFKMERNDKPNATGTPTILYNRGLVAGPRRPHGRNEDFDLEIYTLALQQREIKVDAVAGTP